MPVSRHGSSVAIAHRPNFDNVHDTIVKGGKRHGRPTIPKIVRLQNGRVAVIYL